MNIFISTEKWSGLNWTNRTGSYAYVSLLHFLLFDLLSSYYISVARQFFSSNCISLLTSVGAATHHKLLYS